MPPVYRRGQRTKLRQTIIKTKLQNLCYSLQITIPAMKPLQNFSFLSDISRRRFPGDELSKRKRFKFQGEDFDRGANQGGNVEVPNELPTLQLQVSPQIQVPDPPPRQLDLENPRLFHLAASLLPSVPFSPEQGRPGGRRAAVTRGRRERGIEVGASQALL